MPSRKSSAPEQLGLDWPEPPRIRGRTSARRVRALPALVAGVDEAGRGPLAGPVVAAAVILDELRPLRGLADSKALTPVRRDRLCLDLHERFPGYGFDVHKGYPTPDHLEALQRLGPCVAHRRSFAPVRRALAAAGEGGA